MEMSKLKEWKCINDMSKGWLKDPLNMKIYELWRCMLGRCHLEPSDRFYSYYKDSKYHSDFRYLSNFVKWVESQPRFKDFCETFDKVKWCIDKDMKFPGNKNYYPEFMFLTTVSENSKEVINRRGNPNPKVPVIAIDKNNKVLLFKSLNDAKDKGFNRTCISECINKKQKTHRDYKWYKLSYKHNRKYRIKGGEE